MNEKIIDQIVKEIKTLKAGSEFTIREFLLKHNIDDEGIEMFNYYKAVISKIRDIIEMPEEFIGAKVGLPYNIPLIKK